MEHLRQLEQGVVVLRGIALADVWKPYSMHPTDEGQDGFEYRAREQVKRCNALSDKLLLQLHDLAKRNRLFKTRMFKKTIDYGYFFRENALLNVWFLSHKTGLTDEELVHVFDKDPTMVTRCIKNNIEPKLEWFREIGVPTDVVTHRILAKKSGVVFRCSLNKLKANYAWLQSWAVTNEACVRIVTQSPLILSRSRDDMNEKMYVAIVFFGVCASQLSRWPTYFSYSLENRTMLRLAFCLAIGHPDISSTFTAIVGRGDASFCSLKGAKIQNWDEQRVLDVYRRFKTWWLTLSKKEKFLWVAQEGNYSLSSLLGSLQSNMLDPNMKN